MMTVRGLTVVVRRCIVMVCLAGAASAQERSRVAVELSAGVATHSERRGSAYYDPDLPPMARAAVLYRVWRSSSAAVIIAGDVSGSPVPSGDKASCAMTTNGGCRGSFKIGAGESVSLGFQQNIVPRVAVGIAAGVGDFGRTDLAGTRVHGDAELVMRFPPDLAVVAMAQYVRGRAYGSPYWYAPFMIGVRLF